MTQAVNRRNLLKEMAIIVVKNNTIEFQIEKKLEAHFKVSLD